MGQAPTQQRWMPDDQLIPAVLAGNSRRMEDLDIPDRCWLVAGLTLAGLTAEEIADRLCCCLRLVRSVRAMELTMVCTLMQKDANNFADELRLAQGELKARDHELDELRAELARTKGKLDRMIDEKIVGFRICENGHVMDRYNSYVQEKTGKTFCRACNRDKQQEFRDQRKVLKSSIPNLVLAAIPPNS
ncbi:hypothetical protein [Mycobacteroides abscessus]|uniref:hypothetical protein n=1 Tax=Mycobacteroides abscessus TaxID=36809 RepID=UPI001F48373C|nr:hypothetical protein [Mycobacteroides abscessus]